MGLRSLNNTASSFNDPYASTGLEAYLPSNAYFTGKWYGTYGIWAGGYRGATPGDGTTNLIQYVTIATTGNAASGGSLTQARQYLVGCSNGTRGLYMGGTGGNTTTEYNIIEYMTCATPGSNTTDFGDLTLKRTAAAAGCDGVRALCMGGYDDSAYKNIIDYVTVATTGDATAFGDLTQSVAWTAGCNDDLRAVRGGGEIGGNTNVMDYVTFQTLGDATDFGDLISGNTAYPACCSSLVRGIFAGGHNGSYMNQMQYITIATTGDTTDFGDLSESRFAAAGCSNASFRGVFGGGKISNGNTTNRMDYITIATTGDATDFGDLQDGNWNTSQGTGRQGIAALGGG